MILAKDAVVHSSGYNLSKIGRKWGGKKGMHHLQATLLESGVDDDIKLIP